MNDTARELGIFEDAASNTKGLIVPDFAISGRGLKRLKLLRGRTASRDDGRRQSEWSRPGVEHPSP